ncbi:ribbon-helix-helix domain-containing protein [Candidatus Woesearchaeota archaeon]|nr:ribbon-helix-helix domain-containing protein [Candidatus Woesearchaeota archaeon]
MQEPKKERITISIDRELLEWLDKKVAKHIYANRSHGFEFLIAREIEEEEE